MANSYEVSWTWWRDKFNAFELGQRVFVGHCGSGHTVFGEYGTLTRITDKHLFFTTDSGSTIKTAADNLHKVSGKAGQQHNFVSPVLENDYYFKDAIWSPLIVY